ncbi:MAG: hypothetical protein QOG38_2979 [Hyphomicrobiales bacterium]|nr:hypothetical protein [Hyphomicrobiales bacterium]
MADERFRLRNALLAGACGLLLGLSAPLSASAQQAEEDEDTFEQKIIKNFLGGLGVNTGNRPGIDYRERSPLVVPPSRDLPPPEAAAAARNPAWPKEQVKKRAATAPRQNVRAGPEDPGTSSALTPDELRRGAKPVGSSRITDPSQSGSVDEPTSGRPLRPQELNSTNLFTWGNLTRSNTAETAPFTGEPSRSALTQPPPGYQTPSPNAPYGTVTDTPSGWKVPTILSRPEGSSDSK